MKKLIIVFLIGAAIAFFGTNLIRNQSEDAAGKKPRKAIVSVETTTPTTADVFDKGIFFGTIEPASEFMVAPKISGRIKNLYVNINDSVKNGDIIAQLDDEEYILAVAQSNAAMEIAKANYNESQELLEIAKKEFDRVKTMRKQKVASEAEEESAQAVFKTYQAKHLVSKSLVKQSETSLAQAQLQLAHTKVDASWSGGSNERLVAKRFLSEGAMISANTQIVSVIDIATVTIVIDVVERDYMKISKNMKAKIEPDATPNKEFTAKVSRIAPILDTSTRQARVELELDNSNYILKPGMFIKATIIYDSHLKASVIPTDAIARRNEKEGVFIADKTQNIAHFIPITTGYKNNELIEVLSPKIKEDVIVMGHHLLEDGTAIRVANMETLSSAEKKSNNRKGDGKIK